MPIKALSFKGDKKVSKKRKAVALESDGKAYDPNSTALVPTSTDSASAPPTVNSVQIDEDDSWVTADLPSDLSGPTLLILPTRSIPSALACDANGEVFISALENIVDGDARTAEPHDVRQVWVATKVPMGTSKEGAERGEILVSFRGSNGRYLGCSRGGFLRADAVAVGVSEGFRVNSSSSSSPSEGNGPDSQAQPADGNFTLRTDIGASPTNKSNSGYICIQDAGKKGWEVRGDGESGVDELSTLRLRMQAKFKPRLKANKEMRAREKISRRELEAAVGRRLEDDEVKRLKRARRMGTYHEEILDVRVKGKHDKFASC